MTMLVSPEIRVPHPFGNIERVGCRLRKQTTVFLLTLAPVAAILYRFPPERYAFYPRCPVHEYLHLECPGCGATRALSALLHGQVSAALHLNAFVVLVVLPLAAIYALLCVNRWRKRGLFRWPAVPKSVGIALAVLAAAFTLLRNL